MNHASTRSGSLRLCRIGSASLLVLAACSGNLDQNPFGSAPPASGGVAGWVLNGESGEGPSSGGSSAGRKFDGRPAPDGVAGMTGTGGALGGSGGTDSGLSSGGTAGGGTAGTAGLGGATSGAGSAPAGDPRGGEGGSETAVAPPRHAFIFSEYVEGSSNYKALELYAAEASTLDGCALHFYFNGGVQPAALALEGAVAAGQAYTLCTEALSALLTPGCSRVASLRFNGNDAVSLVCDGVVLDTIGKLGDDPGKGWGSGDTSTVDHSLRRRCDAPPDPTLTDDFEPSLGWHGFPVDSFEDLGRRVCIADEGQAGAPGQGGEGGAASEGGAAGEGGAGGHE